VLDHHLVDRAELGVERQSVGGDARVELAGVGGRIEIVRVVGAGHESSGVGERRHGETTNRDVRQRIESGARPGVGVSGRAPQPGTTASDVGSRPRAPIGRRSGAGLDS